MSFCFSSKAMGAFLKLDTVLWQKGGRTLLRGTCDNRQGKPGVWFSYFLCKTAPLWSK